ncbi:hypothetical protein TNCV_4018351 [Trichonephila clavipes]|nr:hypothetical protein TNCV_4018351 [Trichonephila clavipes]
MSLEGSEDFININDLICKAVRRGFILKVIRIKFAKAESAITMQGAFRIKFGCPLPNANNILRTRVHKTTPLRVKEDIEDVSSHWSIGAKVTSPICVLCDTGQDMTAAHLDECSALNDLNCIVKSFDNLKEGRSDGRSSVPKVTTAVCTFALFTGNGFKRNFGDASGQRTLWRVKPVSLHSLLANRNCKIYRQNFEAGDFPSGAVAPL